uniref:Prostate-associated microseminoprotein n=1 Tax=Astatotilapia calliptera TaxID=8154 RepID=A0AAX7V4L4_ASTCA
MELFRVHLLLGAVGFLLWTSGGSAAPMECHFSSRGEIQFFITLFKKKTQTFTFKKNPSVYKKMYYFELFPPPCVRPALCVYEGRHYSLGETWMDNACMQCTCLHPVGVGCCETVHRPVDFPAWCEVQVEQVTCKVSLVQSADPRLPCSPGQANKDPSHGSLQLQQHLEGWNATSTE